MGYKFITMKNIKTICVSVLFSAMLASCCTISAPITATSNPVGSKCGETTSYVYLSSFGAKGAKTGIHQSAQKAGITKISHVDSYIKNIFFGLVQKRTVKVYGE